MVVSVYAETRPIEIGDVFQFAGFYPFDEATYNIFEQSIERLALNDTGVRLVPTSNPGNTLD
jgi:translation elongation factor EF-4